MAWMLFIGRKQPSLQGNLPKHHRDRRPKHAKMSFDEFTKFMKCIEVLGIQWVVKWWLITTMVNPSSKVTIFLWLGFDVALNIP